MPEKRKRKRAHITVGYDENGAPIVKWVSGYSKEEIEAEKARVRAEYAVAQKVQNEKAPALQAAKAPEGHKFGVYARNWYELYKKPNVRSSTRSMYENVLKAHLLPAFGNRDIETIRADDLQRFILGYAEKSTSMVTKIMMVFRQVFAAAIEDDLITKNPVNRVRPPEGIEGERKPITVEAVDAITEAAKRLPDGLLPLMLIYTGMRRGEALGLKWDDLRDGFAHVERAVSYEGNAAAVIGDTKTKSAHRRIPLIPELNELIERDRGQGFVFGGSRVWAYTTFKRRWARLQDQIPALQGVTPHMLRHTYLMLLRRAGVDPVTQQYLMGHSDYETTANSYTHIDDADTSEARKKLVEELPKMLPHIRSAKG